MKKPLMKFVTLGIFTAAVVSCMGCSVVKQAYWDNKVDELCEKDGGVTIYEKVEILKSNYPNLKLTSSGNVILPSEDNATSIDPFFYKAKTEILHHDGSLDVLRFERSIIRSVDKKILSTHVSYARRGGDLKLGFHPSHYSCKNLDSNTRTYSSTITVKGE